MLDAILFKTIGIYYPVENYTETEFGWKLADGNEFLDISEFAGEQVLSELDKIENEDKSDNEIIENDESNPSDDNEYEDFDWLVFRFYLK